VTVFVLLAICALVFLALARPFRQAPPSAGAAPAPPSGSGSDLPGQPAIDAPGDPNPAAASRAPPIVTSSSAPADRSRLLDEKDRLFQALVDLRFDFEAGKLSPEDFEQEDGRLRARAARVLRELEG
jgi:hypothetical protein